MYQNYNYFNENFAVNVLICLPINDRNNHNILHVKFIFIKKKKI